VAGSTALVGVSSFAIATASSPLADVSTEAVTPTGTATQIIIANKKAKGIINFFIDNSLPP
jgi:microcystin-dependent protein